MLERRHRPVDRDPVRALSSTSRCQGPSYLDSAKVAAVPLSAGDIRTALDALSEELESATERAELLVVGGAALVLLYGARQATKDVDACFLKPSAAVVRSAAARVAGSLDLPEDWLNDGAKAYIVTLTEGPILYESESLLVRAPSIAQLLAMKLAAWRDEIDRSDARLLLSNVQGSLEDVRALIEPLVLPHQRDKAAYALDDLWESIHGTT
ncbi:MAG TPA: DUF6036 family nucleotidyltransferase [Polyangiaceae bacterium]|nr:DUF6036 family nucleotidyltransferase [Polyangiaceae bacterium]